MGYGYGGWAPYVSVAERRKKAEKAAAKAKKAGADYSPIAASRGAIAKTFWGKAWCDNLEHYSDYANRLPRGRTYVRNGSVIDLRITVGEVHAQVMGSSLYEVKATVAKVPDRQWQAIGTDCSGSIDSLVELLQGRLSKAVMERICKPGSGLFPSPKEIKFSCSCPDSASMCKHIAAVFYGIGARLDQHPELIFNLRRVDAKDLVAQAGAGLPKAKKGPAVSRVLEDSALADVFGLEMAELRPAKPPTTKSTPRKSAPPIVDPIKVTKAAKPAINTPTKKLVTTKPPIKAKVSLRTAIPKAAVSKRAVKTVVAKPKAKPKAIVKGATKR